MRNNEVEPTLDLNTNKELETNRELNKTLNNIRSTNNDEIPLKDKIEAAINNSSKAIQLYHNIAVKMNELEATLAKLLKANNNKINNEDNDDSWAIENIDKTKLKRI